jgi:hypothetical protein
MDDELRGRIVFTWPGRNRRADTDELARAIASTGELYQGDGWFCRIHGGQKLQVNFAQFRAFLDERIAGVRAVYRDGSWQREYFSYRFDPPPRRDQTKPAPDDDLYPEPDANVLDDLYRRSLAPLLPKVVEL